MSTVFVSNLSATTTKDSLERFLSFCGTIQHVDLQEGHKAVVTFEKPSAASTALMLNGGTLDGSPIQVSSEAVDDDHPSVAGDESHGDDIPQEAKPRTAIVAEYLAHGYVLSEGIINKAVAFDQKHGISSRFLELFRSLTEQTKAKTAEIDAQHHISQKAAGAYAQADEKVKLNEKANKAYQIGKSYYSKVLSSEFGQQALHFYTQTSNNLKSVHEEAQRIAESKKQTAATSGTPTSSTFATVADPVAAAHTAATPAAGAETSAIKPAV